MHSRFVSHDRYNPHNRRLLFISFTFVFVWEGSGEGESHRNLRIRLASGGLKKDYMHDKGRSKINLRKVQWKERKDGLTETQRSW